MLPDRVSNPGPPTYESGVLPIALRGPAEGLKEGTQINWHTSKRTYHIYSSDKPTVLQEAELFAQTFKVYMELLRQEMG